MIFRNIRLIGILFISIVSTSCDYELATIITAAQQNEIETIINNITVATYESHLIDFTNVRHPYIDLAEVIRVEESIIADLTSWYGAAAVSTDNVIINQARIIQPDYSYYFVEGSFSMRNIFATKPGTKPELAPVIIAAHHDTVSVAPGTNDNGTGCAGVLEAAFQLRSFSFERTIIFAFFAFEEEDFVGSRQYVESLETHQYPDSVIVLETIGFTSAEQDVLGVADSLLDMPTRGDFIGAFGSTESKYLLADFIKYGASNVADLPVYGACLDNNFGSDILLQYAGLSDHLSFWIIKVPALMVTDTAFLRVGNVYHTADDDWSHVDRVFATKVTEAAIATLCVKANIIP